MLETFDAYLTSLRRRLAIKVGKSKAEELTREIESHLHNVREDVAQSGKTVSEAEREAIQRMGPDKLLAEDLARASGGWTHSMLAYTLLPGVLLALAGMITTVESVTLSHYWNGIILAFFVVFIWQAARSQKWIAFPISALIFLVISAVMVVQVITWRDAAVPGLKLQAERIEKQLQEARQGMEGTGPLRSLELPQAPYDFHPSTQDAPHYALIGADSQMAEELWAKNGQGYEAQLLQNLSETNASIAVRVSWMVPLRHTMSVSISLLCALLAINALVLAARAGRRRYLESKWRMA